MRRVKAKYELQERKSRISSCDTNNVLNGEEIVSLAWGAIGGGATSMISSQWEANDRSTEIFAGQFYWGYWKGFSDTHAMQPAAIAMIRKKH